MAWTGEVEGEVVSVAGRSNLSFLQNHPDRRAKVNIDGGVGC